MALEQGDNDAPEALNHRAGASAKGTRACDRIVLTALHHPDHCQPEGCTAALARVQMLLPSASRRARGAGLPLFMARLYRPALASPSRPQSTS